MLLTVTKNHQNVQKALKNFVEILNVDVRLLDHASVICVEHRITFVHRLFVCRLLRRYNNIKTFIKKMKYYTSEKNLMHTSHQTLELRTEHKHDVKVFEHNAKLRI